MRDYCISVERGRGPSSQGHRLIVDRDHICGPRDGYEQPGAEEDAEVLREPVKAKGAVEQREVASTGGKKWSKASLVVVVRVARRNGAPMVGTDGEAVAGALLGTAELMEVAAWLGVVGNDSKRRPELVKVMVAQVGGGGGGLVVVCGPGVVAGVRCCKVMLTVQVA
uniref:DUF834 domain-containing protein n=2 Tax=Oryza sativa subsp. japonica TaxID=39947 RepID=Q53NU1_ORYSJ|nr:hypothetical protein LOC_Os11g24650 [Oryza sativa Japonica Group]ABA93135.1 hypothetical protein LOC_Os11g24650 [Oryza sativa Japonica Group]